MDRRDGNWRQPEVLPALLAQLQQLLESQHKFQPKLTLPTMDDGEEVTMGIRDGSAYVLRCLKIWYDLPSDVLFIAVNIMDRFLTKMKVLPKHIACISIASFYIGCEMVCSRSAIPKLVDMIKISQCKCTESDVGRMQAIISSKICVHDADRPVTASTFLQVYHRILLATENGDIYERSLNKQQMFQRLEIIVCNGSCGNFEASQVALVLLWLQMGFGVARHQPSPCAYIDMLTTRNLIQLRQFANVDDSNFYNCLQNILEVVEEYNSYSRARYRQRLVWRLSQRTLKHLRPTNKIVSKLPTIVESTVLRIGNVETEKIV